jgi:hypothetical protein
VCSFWHMHWIIWTPLWIPQILYFSNSWIFLVIQKENIHLLVFIFRYIHLAVLLVHQALHCKDRYQFSSVV